MTRRALVALLLAGACARPRQLGALEADVELARPLGSACVQVVVRAGGSELRSRALGIAGLDRFEVGIGQGALPARVKVYAQGFSDAACATPTVPEERSVDVDAEFVPGEVTVVELRLQAPGAREVSCANGADDDSDSDIDCADADCDARPCAGGGDCEERVCRGATTEQSLCADSEDNDADGETDCADDDCVGSACASADRCLTGTTCSAQKSCGGGTPRQCLSPGPCRTAPGSCDGATGACSYPAVAAGAACDDGDPCTALEACDGVGACVPDAGTRCEAPPGPCFTAQGSTCEPGRGCVYPVAAAARCDDGRSCTAFDRCAPDGGCAGTLADCAPAACEAFGGACAPDAGCLFTALDSGLGCDGGVCNGTGACTPLFPYPPSNFTEAQVPNPAIGGVLLDCGVSVIDTQVAGPPTFSSWCGQPLPGATTLWVPGGPDAVLLSFGALTVATGATLQVRGARPLIIAATGDVAIAGLVEVLAGAGDCADGGAGERGGTGLTNGGGGGGSFSSAGGSGGSGSVTVGSSGPGGRGGEVDSANLQLVPLRGGCPGGLGAASGTPRPASGGGALQISSAASLVVSGALTAPGQGGPTSNNGTGGNGAGSGGALLLEALVVTLTPNAVLAANGGGGGEGGGPVFDGEHGSGGKADGGAAAGGSSANSGGAGGHGAAGALGAANGDDGNSGTGNGGGGGGGLGRIRVRAAVSCSVGSGVVASPAINGDGGC